MKLPKLVIFDMDGVIIDSERVSKQALLQALKEYEYPDADHLFHSLMGKSRKNSIEYLNELYHRDSKAMFDRQTELFFAYFDEHHPSPKKGFNELYNFYKKHHIPMCIASSSRRTTIDHLLHALNLENQFDAIFSGDQVTHSKPDPEIFLMACEYFHVNNKDALVIEDSKNGIQAAVNANIPVIGVVDTVYHNRDVMEKTLIMVNDLDAIVKLYHHPKVVLFDMDGLLVDTEKLWVKPYQKAYIDHGYQISQEALDATIGASGTILENILKSNQPEDFPLEKIMKKADEYFYQFIQKELPIKEGAIELLEYYQSLSIPCIVASSSSRSTIEMYLKLTNMSQYFVDIACIDDVEKSKPDPAIFLKGCEKMHCDIKDALVYEDSKNGIIAAKRAGIEVICIPDLIYHDQEIFADTLCFSKSLHNLIEF